MANYTKLTDFASKDSLPTGTPAKIIKGTEIDDELQSIENAISTKADTNNPEFTGIPTAPTATTATNSTQIATTAYVSSKVNTLQPQIDTLTNDKAPKASPTFTGSVNAGDSIVLGSWTIWDNGGYLYFKYGSNNVFRLDSSGNMIVEGNVTAYGSV